MRAPRKNIAPRGRIDTYCYFKIQTVVVSTPPQRLSHWLNVIKYFFILEHFSLYPVYLHRTNECNMDTNSPVLYKRITYIIDPIENYKIIRTINKGSEMKLREVEKNNTSFLCIQLVSSQILGYETLN